MAVNADFDRLVTKRIEELQKMMIPKDVKISLDTKRIIIPKGLKIKEVMRVDGLIIRLDKK